MPVGFCKKRQVFRSCSVWFSINQYCKRGKPQPSPAARALKKIKGKEAFERITTGVDQGLPLLEYGFRFVLHDQTERGQQARREWIKKLAKGGWVYWKIKSLVVESTASRSLLPQLFPTTTTMIIISTRTPPSDPSSLRAFDQSLRLIVSGGESRFPSRARKTGKFVNA